MVCQGKKQAHILWSWIVPVHEGSCRADRVAEPCAIQHNSFEIREKGPKWEEFWIQSDWSSNSQISMASQPLVGFFGFQPWQGVFTMSWQIDRKGNFKKYCNISLVWLLSKVLSGLMGILGWPIRDWFLENDQD